MSNPTASDLTARPKIAPFGSPAFRAANAHLFAPQVPPDVAETLAEYKGQGWQGSEPVGILRVVWRGVPMGKPRMTRADRWKKRPAVLRYWGFADSLRAAFDGKSIPKGFGSVTSLSWTAFFEMPASWSKRKKLAMAGKPHRCKPDRDNVDKAILDALFYNDCGICDGTLAKRWDDGNGPRIEITMASTRVD